MANLNWTLSNSFSLVLSLVFSDIINAITLALVVVLKTHSPNATQL